MGPAIPVKRLNRGNKYVANIQQCCGLKVQLLVSRQPCNKSTGLLLHTACQMAKLSCSGGPFPERFLGFRFRLRLRHILSVAIRASFWSWLVEQDQVLTHHLLVDVAGCAGHVLVTALQREGRLFVVEERRLPLVAGMACSATFSARAELPRMRILMAIGAAQWRLGEIDMQHRLLEIRRPMTIGAVHSAVRSFKLEVRRGVIEAR